MVGVAILLLWMEPGIESGEICERGALRLFREKQRPMRVESEFERKSGAIVKAKKCRQEGGCAAQMAIAAIVALRLG